MYRLEVNSEHVIGIVGGMGPQAGIDLLNHITRLTPARKDQDHRSVVLMSYPSHISDRTAYIEGLETINPAYSLAEIIIKLEKTGAKVAAMACNSAHIPRIYDIILEELKLAGSKIKLLHLPEETCHFIKMTYPNIRRVGIMATNGTYSAGLYTKKLIDAGLEPIMHNSDFQHSVIHRIVYDPEYGIKSCPEGITNQVKGWLKEAILFFKRKKAEAIILGCTEFCLAIPYLKTDEMHLINSNEAIARALIRETAFDYCHHRN